MSFQGTNTCRKRKELTKRQDARQGDPEGWENVCSQEFPAKSLGAGAATILAHLQQAGHLGICCSVEAAKEQEGELQVG